jgi:hypothetical protein
MNRKRTTKEWITAEVCESLLGLIDALALTRSPEAILSAIDAANEG